MSDLPAELDRDTLIAILEANRPSLVDTANTLTSLFAEDCVQEAILKSIDKIDTFNGNTQAQLVGWVRRIIINECLSNLRLKGNANKLGISKIAGPDTGLSSPSKHLRREEELEKLNQALDKLTDRERDAVVYHYLLGMSVQDTADVMGITKGATQGLLFRAMKKLGKELSESQFSVLV